MIDIVNEINVPITIGVHAVRAYKTCFRCWTAITIKSKRASSSCVIKTSIHAYSY